MIKFKDIFLTYYQEKYLMLIDDLLLLRNTFESLYLKDIDQMDSHLLKYKQFDEEMEKCLTNLALIPNSIEYIDPWYKFTFYDKKNSTNEMINNFTKKKMIGTWIQKENITNINNLTISQKYKLSVLCQMDNLMKKIFEKNVQWSFKYPIQIEHVLFAFDDSFFYKYPKIHSDVYTKAKIFNESNNCEKFDLNKNIYDPKCRPFYDETIKSKSEIKIILPYIHASTKKFGTELCIRSRNHSDPLNKDISFVVCYSLNFKDIDSFRSQLKGLLTDKKLFIVNIKNDNIDQIINKNTTKKDFTNNDTNLTNIYDCDDVNETDKVEIRTIYSGDILSEDFFSVSKAMGLTNYTSDNFFDILNFNFIIRRFKTFFKREISSKKDTEFVEYLKNLSEYNTSQEYKEAESKFKNFDNFLKYYKTKIKCPIIKKSHLIYKEENYNKLSNDPDFSFSISSLNSEDNIDNELRSNYPRVNIDYFIFPAFTLFNLTDKDKIYNLNYSDFFIIIAGKFSNDELFKKFQLGLLYKFLVFAFYLAMFNLLMWFLLTGLIFYFFKIFFHPLKKIIKDFRSLYHPDVILSN